MRKGNGIAGVLYSDPSMQVQQCPITPNRLVEFCGSVGRDRIVTLAWLSYRTVLLRNLLYAVKLLPEV